MLGRFWNWLTGDTQGVYLRSIREKEREVRDKERTIAGLRQQVADLHIDVGSLQTQLDEAEEDVRFEADDEFLVRNWSFTGKTVRAALTKLAAWEGWEEFEQYGRDAELCGPIAITYDDTDGLFTALLTSPRVEED
jgi:hypothetical protein